MTQTNEPHVIEGACSYCGNAPINHHLSFFESSISVTLDDHAKKIFKYVPKFIKKFVDAIPEFLFRTLRFIGLVKFSKDVERAYTFRSKVIWEEATKRGIRMEQVIFLGKPLDFYRAMLNVAGKNRYFYFESIPIRPEFLDFSENWDDKAFLKNELKKNGIPTPFFVEFFSPFLSSKDIEKIFYQLPKPVIVKPRVGSRGRHTITNILDLDNFKTGIKIAGKLSPYLVVEEHLMGDVCRATFVNHNLVGFYRSHAPSIKGDGKKSIRELILELDQKRSKRVEPIRITEELKDNILRSGFSIEEVLPMGVTLQLSHRRGRLFGGQTKEMLDDLHPSFIPILKKASCVTGLSVVGFDVIIPDPLKPANAQHWGIIECNTLPFIDLHYYALEGRPKNIAGMIWDLWK